MGLTITDVLLAESIINDFVFHDVKIDEKYPHIKAYLGALFA